MAADLIATHPELARTDLNEVVPLYRDQRPDILAPMRFETRNTTLRSWKYEGESEFGLFMQTNPGTVPTPTGFSIPRNKEVSWLQYATAYEAHDDAIRSDQFGVLNKVAAKMAYSAWYSDMILGTDVLNQGFNTAAEFLGWDGVPLFDAPTIGSGGHPYEGGVVSNRGILVGATWMDVAASYNGLMAARTTLMNTLSEKGKMLFMMGPFNIIHGNNLDFLFGTIMESQGRPQTTDNDANYAIGKFKHFINPLMTSTTQFVLVDSSYPAKPFFQLVFKDYYTNVKHREEDEMMAYYGRFKKYRTFRDFRGTWSTVG